MADKHDLITIVAGDVNSGRMLELSDSHTLTGETLITVPMNYRAEVIVDGARVATVKPCQKKKLLSLVGSEHDGKAISVLFVNRRRFNTISWGVGNLRITYGFLDNASLSVGASGTLLAELTDPAAFYTSLGIEERTLSMSECISIIVSAFRVCASKVLTEMFKEARQPIFSTDFLVDELDRRIKERVCNRVLEGVTPGIVFTDATVALIRVNEDDRNAFVARYGWNNRK